MGDGFPLGPTGVIPCPLVSPLRLLYPSKLHPAPPPRLTAGSCLFIADQAPHQRPIGDEYDVSKHPRDVTGGHDDVRIRSQSDFRVNIEAMLNYATELQGRSSTEEVPSDQLVSLFFDFSWPYLQI